MTSWLKFDSLSLANLVMIASFFRLYPKTAKNPRLTKTGYKKAKFDPLKMMQSVKNPTIKNEISLKFPLSKTPLKAHKIASTISIAKLNSLAKKSTKG